MLVRVQDVGKTYKLGVQVVTAPKNVNLNIDVGCFPGDCGPIGQRQVDASQSHRVDRHSVARPHPDRRAGGFGKIAGQTCGTSRADDRLCIPNVQFASWSLTAEENVEYPLLQFEELSAAERRERVRHYLDVVGFRAQAKQRPDQLSGGQRQRVAIARALATHPRLILADEPTANLDHRTGGRILRLMRRLNRLHGTTIVFSTHDPRVLDMADQRVDLDDGVIVRLGVRNGEQWAYAAEREWNSRGGRQSENQRTPMKG